MKYLNPARDFDLDWLLRERNKPEVMMWFRQMELLTEEDQALWWAKEKKNPHHHHWIIRKSPHWLQARLGYCALRVDPRHKSAEFSVFTVPRTNAGYFALREMYAYGFSKLGLNRIWSDVIVGNPAITLYQKMGFKVEGRLREAYLKNGAWKDSDIIGMTRGDYARTLNRRLRQHGQETREDTLEARGDLSSL